MVNIPDTSCYDGTTNCISKSEFCFSGKDDPIESQIVLKGFLINQYGITNQEYQLNFMIFTMMLILSKLAIMNVVHILQEIVLDLLA